MPAIASFYGILILMHLTRKEHNPPHIHVIYQEETFSLTIKDLRIIDGETNPSPRLLAMVKEWVLLHQNELLKMWETQDIHELDPLK